MKKTRKIISIIMCVAIALSVFTIITGLTINNTMFNSKFVAKYLITSDLQNECNDQLKLKFKVLEKKSNIPARVFKKVLDDKPTEQIMKVNVENFFSDRDTSLNSDDIADYFYDLCVEYLDENNATYNEEDIKNTAKQAAKIYSDSVGFNNVEHIKLYVDEQREDINRAISLAFGYLIVACFLMYFMYSDPKQSLKYMAQTVISSGTSGILVSIVSVAAGFGLNLKISPDAYMEAFNHLVKAGYFWLSVVSLAVVILGILFASAVQKAIDKEHHRRESRFYKRLDNIK